MTNGSRSIILFAQWHGHLFFSNREAVRVLLHGHRPVYGSVRIGSVQNWGIEHPALTVDLADVTAAVVVGECGHRFRLRVDALKGGLAGENAHVAVHDSEVLD